MDLPAAGRNIMWQPNPLCRHIQMFAGDYDDDDVMRSENIIRTCFHVNMNRISQDMATACRGFIVRVDSEKKNAVVEEM